jgi:cytochrome c-type biogenesis protein CcmH
MRLGGESEEKLLGLFEALTLANEGIAPPETKPVLEAALARNPKSVRGRVWLGIVASQDGRKAEAENIYRQLLGEDIPQAWKTAVGKQLAALNSAPAATGNTATDEAAGEKLAMIQSMVERLAARLKENGADLEGWLRLIRSYAVLHETSKALDATASARQQFASEPQAIEQIDHLAGALGLAKTPAIQEGRPQP